MSCSGFLLERGGELGVGCDDELEDSMLMLMLVMGVSLDEDLRDLVLKMITKTMAAMIKSPPTAMMIQIQKATPPDPDEPIAAPESCDDDGMIIPVTDEDPEEIELEAVEIEIEVEVPRVFVPVALL